MTSGCAPTFTSRTEAPRAASSVRFAAQNGQPVITYNVTVAAMSGERSTRRRSTHGPGARGTT